MKTSLSMNLFKCRSKSFHSKLDDEPLICNTPFGKLFFQLTCNDKEVFFLSPRETYSHKSAIISSWRLEGCEVEFFRADFTPKIPAHMSVNYCTAGIWRIKSIFSNLKLDFRTFIEHGLNILNTDGESGEGLTSFLCENNQFKLSIGTEDEEYLASRASLQKWMPQRFRNIFLNNLIVECMSNGLKVDLPPLNINETVQIQFVIAWSSKENYSESTWFAVDASADYILKLFGIS